MKMRKKEIQIRQIDTYIDTLGLRKRVWKRQTHKQREEEKEERKKRRRYKKR